MVDILALGEPLAEFVQQTDAASDAPLYRQGFGGDTSNALIAAARQGASTGYLSAVGDDPFGTGLRALWDAESVDHRHVVTRSDAPTGVYFVKPDPAGRQFWYARQGSAASRYNIEDLPEAAIADAQILHVSAISQAISPSMRAAVTRAAEIARAHDTLVSYDTNLRLNLWSLDQARTAITDFLPLADIVLPSDDEVAQLTGLNDPDAIADHYLGQGTRIVVLKRGAQGAYLATPEHRTAIEAVSSVARDSTGAGDSFAGAFLAYLIETGDPGRAAHRAARVAAGTVSGFGAIAPIPYRHQIMTPADTDI